MPVFVIPSGFAHVAIEMKHTSDPQPWFCTFGIQGPAFPSDGIAVANGILKCWDQEIGQHMNQSVSSQQVILTIGQGTDPPVKAYSNIGLLNSGSTTAKLPQNCALLVDKLTALGGRRNRGRMYVPSVLAEGDVSDTGNITNSALTLLQTSFNNFFEFMQNGSDLTQFQPALAETPMQVLHRPGISVVGTPTPVSSLRVQPVITTQRKRLR